MGSQISNQHSFTNMDMRANDTGDAERERGEGRGVGNDLDRQCVDITNDDGVMFVQKPTQPDHYSTWNQNTK